MPLIENVTEINETGSLGKFDSNLGTLTGATLEIHGTVRTQISLTNSAATTVNARATGDTQLSWTSGLGPLDSLLPSNNGGTMILTFSTGAVQSYTAGQSRNFGPLTDAETFSYDLVSILSSLQAPGGDSFTLNASSLSGFTLFGGGGAMESSQNTSAGAGASISYIYTPIPEPAGATLLGVGILLALPARRRM